MSIKSKEALKAESEQRKIVEDALYMQVISIIY